MPFEFERTAIPDVILVKPKVFGDDRGYFKETYRTSDFRKNGIDFTFMQDSQSASGKGVLRGLHYQLEPKAQGKLVSVAVGSMFDVAVDIRTGSPYFGKWVSEILTDKNHHMLWIPPGFAHGFAVLDDYLVMNYKFTNEYNQDLERGVLWNDPAIAIDWPLDEPTISERDSKFPTLSEIDNPFTY